MRIKCKHCNTIIEGDGKGTYITCKCNKCAIDETKYYWRIIGNKEDFEEIGDVYLNIKNDYIFQDIIIGSLRYSLGRRTYSSDETIEFIMNHKEIITERVCKVMLRDLKWYFEDRKNGIIIDDTCDYSCWLKLQNWLFEVARNNNYDVVTYEKR